MLMAQMEDTGLEVGLVYQPGFTVQFNNDYPVSEGMRWNGLGLNVGYTGEQFGIYSGLIYTAQALKIPLFVKADFGQKVFYGGINYDLAKGHKVNPFIGTGYQFRISDNINVRAIAIGEYSLGAKYFTGSGHISLNYIFHTSTLNNKKVGK